MLSLPRANYLTSAAAGLPLMLVRLLMVSLLDVHALSAANLRVCSCWGFATSWVASSSAPSHSVPYPPGRSTWRTACTWRQSAARCVPAPCIQSSAVVLQAHPNRFSAQPMLRQHLGVANVQV